VELAFRLRVTMLVVDAVNPDGADHLVRLAQADGEADPLLRLVLLQALEPAFQRRNRRHAAATAPEPFGFLALPLGDDFGVVLLERAQVDSRSDAHGVRRRRAFDRHGRDHRARLAGAGYRQLLVRRVTERLDPLLVDVLVVVAVDP